MSISQDWAKSGTKEFQIRNPLQKLISNPNSKIIDIIEFKNPKLGKK